MTSSAVQEKNDATQNLVGHDHRPWPGQRRGCRADAATADDRAELRHVETIHVRRDALGPGDAAPPASVYLLVKKEDAERKTEEWAVEGDSIDKMRAAGYSDDIVRVGAVIRVRGFRAKPGASVVDTIAGPRRGALSA